MGFDGTSYKPSTNQAPPYIKRWAKLVVGILRKSDSSDPQISFIIIRIGTKMGVIDKMICKSIFRLFPLKLAFDIRKTVAAGHINSALHPFLPPREKHA